MAQKQTAAEQFASLRKKLSETAGIQSPLPEKILALLKQYSFKHTDQSDVEGNGTMFQIDYELGRNVIRFQYNVTKASQITVIINPFRQDQSHREYRYITIDKACEIIEIMAS